MKNPFIHTKSAAGQRVYENHEGLLLAFTARGSGASGPLIRPESVPFGGTERDKSFFRVAK